MAGVSGVGKNTEPGPSHYRPFKDFVRERESESERAHMCESRERERGRKTDSLQIAEPDAGSVSQP